MVMLMEVTVSGKTIRSMLVYGTDGMLNNVIALPEDVKVPEPEDIKELISGKETLSIASPIYAEDICKGSYAKKMDYRHKLKVTEGFK